MRTENRYANAFLLLGLISASAEHFSCTGDGSLADPARHVAGKRGDGLGDPCGTCAADYTALSGANWTVCWRQDPLRQRGLIISNACFMNRRVLNEATQPFTLVPYHGRSPRFKDGINPLCDGLPLVEIPMTTNAEIKPDTDNPGYPAFGGYGAAPAYEKLEIATTYHNGNYRYRQRWVFHGTGAIDAMIGLGGFLNGDNPERAHFHSVYWRMDLDLDDFTANFVEEFSHSALANPDVWTALTQEGARVGQPNQFTKWRVRSNVQNAQGQFHSYEIETRGQPNEYGTAHVWPTVAHLSEDGSIVGTADCSDLELQSVYSTPPESIDGADIVIWVAAHFHHETRNKGEERSRMPGFEWMGVKLLPRNFLDATP